jgi:hypothetical protein
MEDLRTQFKQGEKEFSNFVTVILRTHKRTKSNSFSDALFRTLTVAPSVGLFSKLATKPTKPIIVLSP